MGDANPWEQVLSHLRAELTEEDFRRWFAPTAYAADSGDQITVWVLSEAARRHVAVNFQDAIDRALEAIDRADAVVRFVVSGTGDEEEEQEE